MSDATASKPPFRRNTPVAEQHLQLVVAAIQRTPLPLLLMDVFAAALIWHAGWPLVALLWGLAYAALHLLRWTWVRHWRAVPPANAPLALQRLGRVFVALGGMLGLMVVLVFASPVDELHYAATALCVGISAGAVVATAWSPRVFAFWGLLVGSALIGGWLIQGGWLGMGLAGLTLALFWVLFAQSRDQQQALRRLVLLAEDNASLAASLRAERDRAESASQSKTRFFAAASHDLRQPLHALGINAYALAMLARQQGDAKVLRLAEAIDRALRQSNSLLDGLLDVSRLDAGAVQPAFTAVDAAGLLDGVRHEFAPLAAQRGLSLSVELPATPLPSLHTDPDLLRRVLHNLVGNGLKFSRSGGVRLVAEAAAPGQVRLRVIDTGCGIAADQQQRVFEEFYQVANAARDRDQGLGLGLAIVRRIAALLAISLQLDSVPGQGTEVRLTLQARAAPVPAPVVPAEPVAALQQTVLVIDDEADIREAMVALIETLGGSAQAAASGDDALRLLDAGFAPDLLIADHRLREHDGLHAVAQVLARTGPRPVVLVTGDTAPQTLQRLRDSGWPVVHKPVDGASLARAIRQAASQAPPQPVPQAPPPPVPPPQR